MTEKECIIKDDMSGVIERLIAADGIIIGTEVDWGTVSVQLKRMMDRAKPLARALDFPLYNRVGGAITVSHYRYGGQETGAQTLHRFFLTLNMIVVGSNVHVPLFGSHYGGLAISERAGDVKNDEGALMTTRSLGERIAEVAKIIKCAKHRER